MQTLKLRIRPLVQLTDFSDSKSSSISQSAAGSIPPPLQNKFVRTKMRPKEGTKIELQRDLSDFVRFVRFSGLDVRFVRVADFRDLKKTGDPRTDGPTDGRTDRRTDPHIEMRGRI